MLKKVLIISNPNSQYNTLAIFSQELLEAFQRQNIEAKIITTEEIKNNIYTITNYQPDITIAFNGPLPTKNQIFLCDIINIPHVAWIVDNANYYPQLSLSKLNYIACVDRYSCEFYKKMNCTNSFFLPHGINPAYKFTQVTSKYFDISFFGTCIPYKTIEKHWPIKYPPRIVELLYKASERTLNDQTTLYQEALFTEIENGQYDVKNFSIYDLLKTLDQYIRGKSRCHLIQSIQCSDIHLFGKNWDCIHLKDYFPDNYHLIKIHPEIDFSSIPKYMAESKIVLNNSPMFKQGGHERIFMAPLLGSVVLTGNNDYLSSSFSHKENILFYDYNNTEVVNDLIEHYLSHPHEMEDIVNKGKQIVLAHHTWDERVKIIRSLFSYILF